MSESSVPSADAPVGEPEGKPSVKMYPESELMEAVKRRDSALARATEAENRLKALEEQKMIETSQFKEGYEKLKPEYEATKAERDALKARVDAIEKATEAKIVSSVEKLSEDDKGEYETFISKLGQEERLGWVENRLAKVSAVSSSPASSRVGGQGVGIKAAQLPFEERMKAFVTNPQAFSKAVK